MSTEALSRLFWTVLVPTLVLWLTGAAGAVTVESIPSPRPHGWTVDLTGRLTPGDLQALNELCEETHRQTGAEMAIVLVGTVEGAEPRELATRLFNHWGIGQQGADNGILLFTALDDRASEIVLGTGIDTEETRRLSREIMNGEMLPLFRVGNVAGALHRGADNAARRIFGATTPASLPAEAASAVLPVIPAPAPSPAPAQAVEAPAVPAYPVGVATGAGASGPGFGFSNLFGVLLFLACCAPVYLKLVPPRCRECRTRMMKLTESGDDLHLEPHEQAEERVGSVNYDVWLCNGCGTMVKRRWARLFTGYSTCPKCSAQTRARDSKVLVEATYSHGGQVRVDEVCAHCDYRYSYTYSTARLEESDSSSSSSSSGLAGSASLSSSVFSSSSDSSSSSSDSSSGFSGGESSGGGASGSW